MRSFIVSTNHTTGSLDNCPLLVPIQHTKTRLVINMQASSKTATIHQHDFTLNCTSIKGQDCTWQLLFVGFSTYSIRNKWGAPSSPVKSTLPNQHTFQTSHSRPKQGCKCNNEQNDAAAWKHQRHSQSRPYDPDTPPPADKAQDCQRCSPKPP